MDTADLGDESQGLRSLSFTVKIRWHFWSLVSPNHRKRTETGIGGGLSFRRHRGNTACYISRHHLNCLFVNKQFRSTDSEVTYAACLDAS